MSAIEMMALALSWITVLFVTFVSQTGAMKLCPHVVRVENGTTSNIKCKPDKTVTDFYWYKGKASFQDLLGTLENGTKIVSGRYKNDYDISSSGALVILNAGIRHESLYDLVMFDSNRSPVEEEVIVNITVSPSPPCPLINNCPPCVKCELVLTSNSGTLKCKVEGSRPLVILNWTTSQTGVNIFQHQPQIKQRDASADSWDSSVIVDYIITQPCEGKIVLQCVAQDTMHILNSTVSTIEISKDQCNAVTSANIDSDETVPSKRNLLAAILVPVLIVLSFVVLLAVFFFIRKCRQRTFAGDAELPLSQSSPDNNLVEQLVRMVKDVHRKICYLQPLPWGKDIHIPDLYTERLCTVTDKNGVSKIPSNELRKDKNITRERLVIFMGEHGDGRTTFFRHIVNEWIEGREVFFLLIYIPLKEVKINKGLSTFVIEDVLKTNQFKTENIEAILRDKHCLAILDGLEDLPQSFQQGIGDNFDLSEHHHIEDFVTISELSQGRVDIKYNNLHVWIASRETDCENFSCPNDYVKVEWNEFSNDQFRRYVAKCCLYYTSYTRKPDEENEEVTHKVKDFLEKNNIWKDYVRAPLLVNLMVHILAAKYTSAVDYLDDKTITNMSTLIHVVIECMKARYVKKNPISSRTQDFYTLENKLGKVALQQKTRLPVRDCKFWVKEIGEDIVKSALKIGLLKLLKACPSATESSAIQFCHQQFSEYLAALYIVRTHGYGSDYEAILKHCEDNKKYRIKKFLRELENLQNVEKLHNGDD